MKKGEIALELKELRFLVDRLSYDNQRLHLRISDLEKKSAGYVVRMTSQKEIKEAELGRNIMQVFENIKLDENL